MWGNALFYLTIKNNFMASDKSQPKLRKVVVSASFQGYRQNRVYKTLHKPVRAIRAFFFSFFFYLFF